MSTILKASIAVGFALAVSSANAGGPELERGNFLHDAPCLGPYVDAEAKSCLERELEQVKRKATGVNLIH